jgi:SagB-type dehydrogenase family enzyme
MIFEGAYHMDGIGRKFMEMTRYENMTETPQHVGMAQPPLELPAEPGAEMITLPDPAGLGFGEQPLLAIIDQRRSLRGYSEQSLTLGELSFLLWCCQGVQQRTDRHTMRTVPSAGARHAFETYVLVNRVEGLRPGLYRFMALGHSLVAANLSDDIGERLTAACLRQGMVANCAAAFFWTAELERMYFRYGERGYRYLHLDAGHACQNLCLAAEAVECGACEIGAFDDEKLDEALGLDGVKRFTVYAATVGKKPE